MLQQAAYARSAISLRHVDRDEAVSTASFWAALLLMLTTMAVYFPVLGLGFVQWDDDKHLLENARFKPPLLKNTLLYWNEKSFFGLYIPMTYSAWTLVAMAARQDSNALGQKLDPYVFHLVNLLLHVLVTLQVFRLLRRYVKGAWPACFGALLFAAHPVQVESVAWISGFRDLLCALFSLLALDGLLGIWPSPRQPDLAPTSRRLRYSVATVCFVLALLCKPTAVTLPALAAILAVGLERRRWRDVFCAIGPWMLLAIPFALLTKLAQPSSQADIAIPLWQRCLVAADALSFYLYKLLLPLRLCVDYGRTPSTVREQGWLWWTWLVPVAATVVAFTLRKRLPVVGIGLLLMLAALLPVLGFVPFHFQRFSTVADHYLYLVLLAPALVAAVFLERHPTRILQFIAVAVLLALSVRSFMQIGTWRDTGRLFEHTLAVNDRSYLAHSNLSGWILQTKQRPDIALEHSRKAVELSPTYSDGWLNLGVCYQFVGKSDLSIAAFYRCNELNPRSALAHHNLGLLYAARGDDNQALQQFRIAGTMNPEDDMAHRVLKEGIGFLRSGLTEAMPEQPH
jgi:Tfp pilus assembly protein PilF